MTSRPCIHLTKLALDTEWQMDLLDWLGVLLAFAIALYLVFGDARRNWPPLTPPGHDDEGRS